MEQRLLCVFAHPDDESYGPAGTIREIATRPKGRARLVIATRGEAGSIGLSKQYTRADLARVRQWEVMASARMLGAELRVLGWPDGGVPGVDPDAAARTIAREIRLFRPQVILTFHPNGISGHADHKAITAFTVAAAGVAADPRVTLDALPAWTADRLFYYAVSASRGKKMESFRTVHTVPDAEVSITLDTSRHVAAQHLACLSHGTQLDFYRQLHQAEGGLDLFWSTEHLVAEPSIGGHRSGLNDPFDDLS